jgi:KDO2-lipid IV(A) lauroyltransferase
MLYKIVYAGLYLLSLLPLRVLYLLSDFAFVLVYYVLKYRRDVVDSNLLIAFPEKSAAERREIGRRFYHNFTDNFIESLKSISAGPAFFDRHLTGDFSLPNRIYDEGKACQLLMGHNFNWEIFGLSFGLKLKHLSLPVYQPLSSKVMDKVFIRIRNRFGNILIPSNDMRNKFFPHRNKLYALLLIADQSPAGPDKGWWVPFFGRPTLFVTGPEKNGRIANTPIIFCYLRKVKRGRYEAFFELMTDKPAEQPRGAITREFARLLEEKMRQDPSMWLWSHRRWKWEWKEEYGKVL